MSTARGRGEARSEPAATCRAGFRPRLLSRTGPSSEETSGPSAAPHPGNQSVRQRGLAGVLNRLRVTSRGRGLQGLGQGRGGRGSRGRTPSPRPAPRPAPQSRLAASAVDESAPWGPHGPLKLLLLCPFAVGLIDLASYVLLRS